MGAYRSVFVLATLLAVGCGGRAAYEGGASGAAGAGSSGGSGGGSAGIGVSSGSIAVSGVVSGASSGSVTGNCNNGNGCTSGASGSVTGIGSACVTDSDCSGGLACAFEVAAGCSAKGTCQGMPLGGTCAEEPACTCAGTTDPAPTCGFGSGYAHEPIAHQGICGGNDGGADAGRVPVNHRPSDAQCSRSAPPGGCVVPFPDAGCASDNDCTEAGTNGRCINQGRGPAAPCVCTSDTCSVDTDCPNGQTCACQGAPYTDGHSNTCVTGNCRVDADCGAEGYCSPSSLTAICGDSLAGYYCHTAADRCIDDSDCSVDEGCVYSTTDSRWECVLVPVCL